MSLTVTEKEHWIRRLSSLVQEKIDAVVKENTDVFDSVGEQAREAALEELGITEPMGRIEELNGQIKDLEEERDRLKEDCYEQVSGKSVGAMFSAYSCEKFVNSKVEEEAKRQEAKVLEQSEPGRKVLELRKERANIEDAVWLSTTTPQMRKLWKKVLDRLGGKSEGLVEESLDLVSSPRKGMWVERRLNVCPSFSSMIPMGILPTERKREMIKTQVYLTERQKGAIQSMADSRGISFAEQLRRLLDAAIDSKVGVPE